MNWWYLLGLVPMILVLTWLACGYLKDRKYHSISDETMDEDNKIGEWKSS